MIVTDKNWRAKDYGLSKYYGPPAVYIEKSNHLRINRTALKVLGYEVGDIVHMVLDVEGDRMIVDFLSGPKYAHYNRKLQRKGLGILLNAFSRWKLGGDKLDPQKCDVFIDTEKRRMWWRI